MVAREALDFQERIRLLPSLPKKIMEEQHKLPEEIAAEILAGEHYNNFLIGKPIAEDKLSEQIADAIREARNPKR